MAVTRLQDFTALLEDGLSRVADAELKTHSVLFRDWLAIKQAKEWVEDELEVTGFGSMPQKAKGGPFVVDSPFISPEKEYTLIPYGLAFVIEHELIKWDRYRVFSGTANITRKMVRSGTDRKNIVAYAILNNSFSTADPVYQVYNGENLCATSHVLLRGSTTGQNRPTTDIGLSYLGMQEACTDFALLPNEDGLFIILMPELLICHPANQWVGETLLQSDYRPDNANMAKNTVSGKVRGPHVAPYVEPNTNYWWLVSSRNQMRNVMSFDVGEDLHLRSDYQMSSWNRTFSVYGSWRVRLFTWYGIWGTTGA